MISTRLLSILELVSHNSIIADIGTDHGIIPYALLKNGSVKFAILSDISNGSLEKARSLFRKSELYDKVSFRHGDGLSILKPFEVDEIIISGMGGLLISQIIANNFDIAKSSQSIILQANNANMELRAFLIENNFGIYNELLIEDRDKFYEILYVLPKPQPIEYKNFLVSPYWKRDEIFKKYIDYQIMRHNKALIGMMESNTPNIEDIYSYEEKIKIYNEA